MEDVWGCEGDEVGAGVVSWDGIKRVKHLPCVESRL